MSWLGCEVVVGGFVVKPPNILVNKVLREEKPLSGQFIESPIRQVSNPLRTSNNNNRTDFDDGDPIAVSCPEGKLILKISDSMCPMVRY